MLVYWDTVYNSFMFAFPPEPPMASGILRNAAGKALVSQPVSLSVGSQKLTTFTDANGGYRFYGSQSGPGTISAAGQNLPVQVGRGLPVAALQMK